MTNDIGINIDLGSAILASIVIGIAADDTIHFVTRFNKELLRSDDFNQALSATVKTCGRALLYATITLSLGFSIFMLSSLGPLKNGGRLSVPPVLVAFLAPMQQILTLSQFFWVFTALMLFAAIVFALLAAMYKGKTYLQEQGEEEGEGEAA